eukprot:TRINITY_DN751_c0_g2_i9.p2 TRINITY_DN751_c0_g2~~TRINITY_DN751_c0_g2_i9.p2  ORF type:complete len:271 (+),score=101.52 TRINITY_DN751_c0_g2_i9:3-815(+)
MFISSYSFFFFFQAEDGIRDLVRSRGLGDVYKRQVVHSATPEEDSNTIQRAPDQLSQSVVDFHKQTCGVDEDCSVERAYPEHPKDDPCEIAADCVTEQRHGAVYKYHSKPVQKPAGKVKKGDSEDMKRAVHGAHKELEAPPVKEVRADALRWARDEARKVAANATGLVDKDLVPEMSSLEDAKKRFEEIQLAANATVKRLQGAIEGKAWDPEKHGKPDEETKAEEPKAEDKKEAKGEQATVDEQKAKEDAEPTDEYDYETVSEGLQVLNE